MRKVFLLLMALSILLSTSLIQSAPPQSFGGVAGLEIDYPKFEAVKFGTDFNLSIEVFNSSNGMPVNNAGCRLRINNITGTPIFDTPILFIEDAEYRSFLTLNSAEIGEYVYDINCNTTAEGGFASGEFYVTGNGEIQPDSIFLIFIYLIFLVTLVLLVVALILTIAKLATYNETIYGVMLAWSSYILLIFSNYLGHNYILAPFVRNISDNLILAFGFTNVILPIISLAITMFIKSTQKKKLIPVEELTGGQLNRYG